MTVSTTSISAQRIVLWIGLILAGIYTFAYVFLLDFIPPPMPTLGAAQVVDLYAHSNGKFRFGVVVMILAGSFYLPISVVIAVQMARLEKGIPIWAIIEALTGTLGAWIFVLPVVLWGVAAYDVGRSPEITLALNQLAWLCFVTPGSFFSLQLIALTVVCFTPSTIPHSPFPRWFGWLTLWLCLMGDVPPTMAQMFSHGPFAWNGLFAFYMALLVFGIWLVALTALLLRAFKGQELALPTN